jgi:hypothetical protein
MRSSYLICWLSAYTGQMHDEPSFCVATGHLESAKWSSSCLQENATLFFEFSLCLSRACLGKMITFSIQNGIAKDRCIFLPDKLGRRVWGLLLPQAPVLRWLEQHAGEETLFF